MIVPNRGIGWNWQVKGVPSDPWVELQKWPYGRKHILVMALAYLRSVAMLVLMGFGSAIQRERSHSQPSTSVLLDAVMGWSGAIWVWDRLNCFYSLATVVSVTIGLSKTWEWRPLVGSIGDAWSVRQMWGSVYHQVMRRMLSQPAIRVAKFLHPRKGSVTSRYTQLFISFAISCLIHEFQMFNVTRKDMCNFAFFMSQPVTIAAEDLVQWIWGRWKGRNETSGQGRFERFMVFTWTFLWFSYSLPFYIKGLMAAGTPEDALLGNGPMEAGTSLGLAMLRDL